MRPRELLVLNEIIFHVENFHLILLAWRIKIWSEVSMWDAFTIVRHGRANILCLLRLSWIWLRNHINLARWHVSRVRVNQISLEFVRHKESLLVLLPLRWRLELGWKRHVSATCTDERLASHLMSHHLLERSIKVFLIKKDRRLLLDWRHNRYVLLRKPHFRWAIDKNLLWNWWHCLGESPELIFSVCETAKITKAAHPVNFKISAKLCLVITMDSTNVIESREVLWSWIISLPKLFMPVCKWAGVTKCTCLSQGIMSAKLGLILQVWGHLLLRLIYLSGCFSWIVLFRSQSVIKFAMLLILFAWRKIVFSFETTGIG